MNNVNEKTNAIFWILNGLIGWVVKETTTTATKTKWIDLPEQLKEDFGHLHSNSHNWSRKFDVKT